MAEAVVVQVVQGVTMVDHVALHPMVEVAEVQEAMAAQEVAADTLKL
jgi:hypothetical protein